MKKYTNICLSGAPRVLGKFCIWQMAAKTTFETAMPPGLTSHRDSAIGGISGSSLCTHSFQTETKGCLGEKEVSDLGKFYTLSDLCVLSNSHLLSVCYGINTALGTRNRKEERYRGGCGRHTGRLVTSIFLFFLLSRAFGCVAAGGKSTSVALR